jgi:hypothetical protein
MYLQSPLRLLARIFVFRSRSKIDSKQEHVLVNDKNGATMYSLTHFATCVVSQVMPIYLELAVIIHVYQLVGQRIFHVFLVPEMALA